MQAFGLHTRLKQVDQLCFALELQKLLKEQRCQHASVYISKVGQFCTVGDNASACSPPPDLPGIPGPPDTSGVEYQTGSSEAGDAARFGSASHAQFGGHRLTALLVSYGCDMHDMHGRNFV